MSNSRICNIAQRICSINHGHARRVFLPTPVSLAQEENEQNNGCLIASEINNSILKCHFANITRVPEMGEARRARARSPDVRSAEVNKARFGKGAR